MLIEYIIEYDKTDWLPAALKSFVIDHFHSWAKRFSMSSLTFCSYTSGLAYVAILHLHGMFCYKSCLSCQFSYQFFRES